MDYLVLYRPGTGNCTILENDNGAFSAVYAELHPGGYDLMSPVDQGLAFDYEHSGKQDHLIFYRPGTGVIWILENQNGSFSPVYYTGVPAQGIGGFDLLGANDFVISFDFKHVGKLDHLVLYRPGTGTISIVEHDGQEFISVYPQGAPGSVSGIGGFSLSDSVDSAFSFDYEGSGREDYLVFYRPGSGIIEIIKHGDNDSFTPVYGLQNPGTGIGGFALDSIRDAAYAYDYRQTGKLDHIVLYEPGSGSIYIVEDMSIKS